MNFVSRESRQGNNQAWVKVVLALLYKRTSNERRKENPPRPNNRSLYTLRQPPSNHPPCSNVSSEYSTMILDTISTTLIDSTTPHHPTSQHLRPLPYYNKFYYHLSATPSHNSCMSQCLRLSVTPIPPTSRILFLYTPQPVTRNPNRGIDRMLLCCPILPLFC